MPSSRSLVAMCVLFVLIFIAFSPARVLAAPQEPPPLAYAGFALAGDYANRDQLYPHSAALMLEQEGRYLDALLQARLARHPLAASRVTMQLADGRRDVSSVAFALVQEAVEIQRVEGKFLVVIALQANVLAFNKASNTLVANYPLRMRFTRASDSVPSEAELREMVREAYTSNNPAENIFDQWLQRLEKIRLREGARKYLRVTDVQLAPEAHTVVMNAGRTPAALSSQLAHFLEAAVAESAGISIVPSSVGEAIGNKMMYRFANAAELQLQLPQPDFALSFTVRGFASKKIEQPEFFQDIYRVRGAITLRQPDMDRVVLDENVFDTFIVTRPRRAQVQLSDWDQYFKTLQALVFAVGRQMSQVDEAWLKENASRGTDARAGFLNAKQILKELM